MKFLGRDTLRYGLLLAADLSTKVTGLVMTRVIAQHWQAKGFGLWGVALQIVAYALLIGNCGTEWYARKNASKNPEIIGSLATTLVLMRLLVAVPVFALLMVAAWFIPIMRQDMLLIALLGMSLFSAALTLSWVPQAIQNARAMATLNAALPAVNLVTVVVAALVSRQLWSLGAAKLASELVVAAVLFYWTVRYVTRLHRPLPWSGWKEILSRSAPLGASAVLRNLGLGMDMVILAIFIGKGVTNDQLGYYNGALRIYLLAISAGGAYFGLLYPRLASISDHPEKLQRETKASLRRIVFWSVLGMGVVTIFARPILTILLGSKEYGAGAASLQLLIWSALGFHLGSTYQWILILKHRERQAMWFTGISTAVHIGAKFVLIPIMGIEGAAIGMLLGEAVFTVLNWAFARAYLRDTSQGFAVIAQTCPSAD